MVKKYLMGFCALALMGVSVRGMAQDGQDNAAVMTQMMQAVDQHIMDAAAKLPPESSLTITPNIFTDIVEANAKCIVTGHKGSEGLAKVVEFINDKYVRGGKWQEQKSTFIKNDCAERASRIEGNLLKIKVLYEILCKSNPNGPGCVAYQDNLNKIRDLKTTIAAWDTSIGTVGSPSPSSSHGGAAATQIAAKGGKMVDMVSGFGASGDPGAVPGGSAASSVRAASADPRGISTGLEDFASIKDKNAPTQVTVPPPAASTVSDKKPSIFSRLWSGVKTFFAKHPTIAILGGIVIGGALGFLVGAGPFGAFLGAALLGSGALLAHHQAFKNTPEGIKYIEARDKADNTLVAKWDAYEAKDTELKKIEADLKAAKVKKADYEKNQEWKKVKDERDRLYKEWNELHTQLRPQGAP